MKVSYANYIFECLLISTFVWSGWNNSHFVTYNSLLIGSSPVASITIVGHCFCSSVLYSMFTFYGNKLHNVMYTGIQFIR